MLTKEDNEALTRVGAGSVMGDLMRAYWLPALLSSEIPEAGGSPVRVRLLGEDLVAFRNSEGRVGLLEEACPHRGASLALGVNEDCGLRCLYHGWKFGIDGACLDLPTDPINAALQKRMRTKAYKVREAGGMVWAYMGAEEAPPFPEFEWLALPAPQCEAFKILGECNYAQLLEGAIDTVHAGVLHRSKPWTATVEGAAWQTTLQAKLDVEETAYGMRYAGIRQTGETSFNARVTAVAMPVFTLIPTEVGPSPTRRLVNAFVPRDDTSTWLFQFVFDYERPVDRAYRIEEGGLWVDENFRKLSNRDNWYGQDREKMKSGLLSGITGILVQDHAVGETQGRILDRTREHLGTTDKAVVIWRRMMLKAARALRDSGTRPQGTQGGIPFGEIRAAVARYETGESWQQKAPLPDALALADAA